MRIKLCVLLISLIAFMSQAGQLLDYHGKVSVYAKSQNRLALHSHYRYYDKDLKDLKDVSYLELYDSDSVGLIPIYYTEESPRLLALTWTINGEYLIGMSTRWQAESYLYVYSAVGLPLKEFTMDCDLWLDQSREKELETKSQVFISMLGSFCNTTPELYYSLESINALDAIYLGESTNSIGICIGESCVVLPLENSIEPNFMTLYELRDKYKVTDF
ncbi:hypothetical protein [Shewanella ulleungensis]|uniref:hypothetical protein n=1 Tax=Shewanella ulleungensis TaxID=2282699 RepID=UPI003D79DC16